MLSAVRLRNRISRRWRRGGDKIARKYHEWITKEGQERLAIISATGLSRKDIAEVIGVSEKTLLQWEEKYPEISSALKSGNEKADKLVESALLKRAVGYTHTEVVRQINKDSGELEVVKTVEKDVMPSTTAQIFWLKNRCGYEWDGKCEEEDEGGIVLLPETTE